MPRQRIRFELSADAGTFAAGGTVYALLIIEFGRGVAMDRAPHEFVQVAIPIPAD